MEDNYNKNDLDTDINIEEIKQHLNNLDEYQDNNDTDNATHDDAHDDNDFNDNNNEPNDKEIDDKKINDEEKNEKKEIEVITGDGNLDISPVYDHIDIEKPDEKGKKQIIIPEEKK